MFSAVLRHIQLRPYYLALFIVLALCLWMFSATGKSQPSTDQPIEYDQPLPKVSVRYFTPQKRGKALTLYGKSEASNSAIIRAQVAGKVVSIGAQKGSYVDAGSLIASLEKNERPQRLAQALAQLEESQLNYQAAQSLNNKGLQGDIAVASIKSTYLEAQTQVKSLQLALQHTQVTAPFSGILQLQSAEQGDYLQVGDPIFRLENSDPIVIRGDATEHHMSQLQVGKKVTAELLSGEVIEGKLSYISSIADSNSSTFRIEAEFANPQFKILSGISAKLVIPLYTVDAIYVSPSALAMNESGDLGVKTVVDGVVVFTKINLVEADNDGAWIAGFDGPVDIITLGQGFVKPGAQVDAIASQEQ